MSLCFRAQGNANVKVPSSWQIKRAYRTLALRNHPDKGGDAETFKKIAAAYAVLSDAEKRRVYDATGQAELTDLDLEEFLSSGALDTFFREMMQESGMMDEMIGAYGDDTSIEELQASFESFFKASMGLSTGPVLMPDGTTIDASQARKNFELASSCLCFLCPSRCSSLHTRDTFPPGADHGRDGGT